MMILSQAINYAAPAIPIAVVLGAVYWITKTRVDNKTCDRTHKAVDIEHTNLRAYIKDTEDRQEKRHDELVSLIKNNGHGQPRIQT